MIGKENIIFPRYGASRRKKYFPSLGAIVEDYEQVVNPELTRRTRRRGGARKPMKRMGKRRVVGSDG
jgi:hypothetical protein